MALSKKFKEKTEHMLRNKLKTYHVSSIEHEHEEVICGYNPILTDFCVKLHYLNLTLLIEVECHRVDPLHNLVKTLMWLEETNPKDPIILLHVFDEAYTAGDKPNKSMCDYIYPKLKNCYPQFYYHSINISGLSEANMTPPQFPIRTICKRIVDVLEKLVKKKAPQLGK